MVLEFLIGATIGLGITEALTSRSPRPGGQQRLLKQARDHLTWNRYKQALPILIQLTEENPSDPEYYALLACCYDNLANSENRLASIEKALESIEAISRLVERGSYVPEHVQLTLAERQRDLEVLSILESARAGDMEAEPRSDPAGLYSWNNHTKKYRCQCCLKADKHHYCKTLQGIRNHVLKHHPERKSKRC